MVFVKGLLGALGWGYGGCITVLSFACKQFEVSSVVPQQIIQFAFERTSPAASISIQTQLRCAHLSSYQDTIFVP